MAVVFPQVEVKYDHLALDGFSFGSAHVTGPRSFDATTTYSELLSPEGGLWGIGLKLLDEDGEEVTTCTAALHLVSGVVQADSVIVPRPQVALVNDGGAYSVELLNRAALHGTPGNWQLDVTSSAGHQTITELAAPVPLYPLGAEVTSVTLTLSYTLRELPNYRQLRAAQQQVTVALPADGEVSYGAHVYPLGYDLSAGTLTARVRGIRAVAGYTSYQWTYDGTPVGSPAAADAFGAERTFTGVTGGVHTVAVQATRAAGGTTVVGSRGLDLEA